MFDRELSVFFIANWQLQISNCKLNDNNDLRELSIHSFHTQAREWGRRRKDYKIVRWGIGKRAFSATAHGVCLLHFYARVRS